MLPTHAQLHLPDERATLAVASVFARALVAGDIVWLSGDLGAGKTTFTRGVLRAFGVTGRIKSPTFSLMESYSVTLPLVDEHRALDENTLNFHHFDFYRCTHDGQWRDAGFEEYFEPPHTCMVEWPSLQPSLPRPSWLLSLSAQNAGRTLELQAFTEHGQRWLLENLPQLNTAASAAS
jgi:tRNA threonylcarbamoyladenosine biosynthesis protein TsaE